MFEGKINRIVVFLIYISIFVNSLVLFSSPFEFYIGYLIYFILLPILLMRYGFPKKLVLLFAFLFAYGLLHIYLGNNTSTLFFKIFFGTFLAYLFYYLVIIESEYSVVKLFNYYLKGCYIVCIIGLIQFISFQLNFRPGYDYSWLLNKWGVIAGGNEGIRINSIFGEPSHFAIFISSAVFVGIYNLISKTPYYYTKRQSLLVVLISILSYSGIGYLGFFLCIVLLLINYGFIRYVLIFAILIPVVFNFVYRNVPEFSQRFDSTVDIFSTGQFAIGKTHGSSIILYNNFHIATENFKNYLFGTGLGSHPVAYDKYSLTKHIKIHGFALNSMDANSMFNRLLSETGILGIAIFLLLIIKYFVRMPGNVEGNESHWIISNAILVMILLCLFRQGHYFLNGFPFFIWLYYFNYMVHRKLLPQNASSSSA